MKTLLPALAGVIALASLLHCVDSAPVIGDITDPREKAKALTLLVDYGYLNKSDAEDDSAGGGALDSPAVVKAITDLQKFGSLAVTGKLNDETLKLLNTKRCGLKDPVNKLKPAGKKSGDLSVGEYYLQGTRWNKKDLTYRFISFTGDLGIEQQKSILRRQIQKWAEASTLTITEQTDPSVPDDDVDILIRFVRRYHGDPYPFDGEGGTLAHAYYPHNNKGLSGDAHFDDDERFTTGTKDGINLDWVAVHEFGHSMGLEHSNVRESIMYPWYKGYIPNIELTYDDIQGIQALYGGPSKPPTKKPTPAPTPAPTDPPTAKPETPKPNGVHLACKPGTTYDAIVVEEDTRGGQVTHFFHGDSLFTLSRSLRRGNVKKVKDYFPEVRTPINAAYRNKQGKVVFFSGSRFWEYNKPDPSRYNARRQLQRSGYITQYGLSWEVRNMDAVFTWKKNQKTYIFKGSKYWRYNEVNRRMDSGYPRDIQGGWPDLPDNIDAAVTWSNGKSYVFDGKDYLRLKSYPENRKVYVDRGYPKNTAEKWMKCDSIGALAIGALAGEP
ncbi:hypothetical protein ACROYT_G042276 [Oculina patagonica]